MINLAQLAERKHARWIYFDVYNGTAAKHHTRTRQSIFEGEGHHSA